MQNISDAAMLAEATPKFEESGTDRSRTILDTSFVLFFLAVDTGQNWIGSGAISVVAVLSIAAFIVLPYFIGSRETLSGFSSWIAGRVALATVGVMLGMMLKQSIGTLLPEYISFLPMTLLIVAAIICCNIQIYGILKNRLAR